jgi:glutathione S-transferase
MTLQLHAHPLSSYCHKVLIALYENDTPFEFQMVDLGDPEGRARFAALWPMGKMPVLRDEVRGETVAESSIVIEYLDQHYPGAVRFLPADPELARRTRFWDRIFDNYVQGPMQRIVGDRIRPAGAGRDPFGVTQARAQLATSYGMIEREMAAQTWAAGEAFTLADCAAAPALFYADKVAPFGADLPHTQAYLQRLMARPSFARVLAEAEPYFAMFPQEG